MAYSVPNLNPSPATYPQVHNGGAFSAVGSKNPLVASVGSVTATEDVKTHYTEVFNNHAKVQNNLLKQLNVVFGKNISMDGNRHVNFTDFIKDVCVDSDQANDAYKFYGRQIIEQINQLGDYILKARALLEQVMQEKNYIIDQLGILDGFSKEINETFGFRYIYDLNEDVWKLYEDDYTDATHAQVQDNTPESYDELRTMKVQAYRKQEYQKDPIFTKKTIEVFNELNLLDRLKYIKLYYDINEGKTDAVFPNDKIRGIPSVKETSTTEVIAATESFFMGYLIDRDGPVNAVSSYLEVKAAALLEKINLESQKIKALNTYLKFLQRALDVLNSSQLGADGNTIKHALPDGAMVALLFLCGGNMYNLFETKDGTQCLVIENNLKSGEYMLISADLAGMNFLLGDRGDVFSPMYPFRDYRGNCYTTLSMSGDVWEAHKFTYQSIPTCYHCSTELVKGDFEYWNDVKTSLKSSEKFVLPAQLDVEKIDPKSVRKYQSFGLSSEVTTETVSSWQKTFQDKLSYVQTSIDTINSDIKVFRNKIDTLNTLSSTFRNRTHTAYMKVASNLRK